MGAGRAEPLCAEPDQPGLDHHTPGAAATARGDPRLARAATDPAAIEAGCARLAAVAGERRRSEDATQITPGLAAALRADAAEPGFEIVIAHDDGLE